MKWQALRIPARELRIDVNLNCGQSFRWISTDSMEWTSVLNGYVVSLTQTEDDTLFRLPLLEQTSSEAIEMTRKHLLNYFQVETCLSGCYQRWCQDPVFAKRARLSGTFAFLRNIPSARMNGTLGIRVLRIDPVENLFSFICSSNNHISRISMMVQHLCRHFGPFIGHYAGHDFYDFPKVHDLTGSDVEAQLRLLGFGYRAKYISKAAQQLCKQSCKPETYLTELRTAPYQDARDALMLLAGVGPKVADCVCLMSLDKRNAIPVDTHVRMIAEKWYNVRIKGKSLTATGYRQIQDHFVNIFGEDAGWAHVVLFAADLKKFEQHHQEPTDLSQNQIEKPDPAGH